WTVLNLLQGALTIALVALSVGAICAYWRKEYWILWHKEYCAVWIAAAIIAGGVGMLALLDGREVIDVTLKNSLHGILNSQILDAVHLQSVADIVNKLGNLSIVVVTLMVPFCLCVLLRSSEKPEQRFERLQSLMYWTAILLVTGAVQVSYQSRWPMLFFD